MMVFKLNISIIYATIIFPLWDEVYIWTARTLNSCGNVSMFISSHEDTWTFSKIHMQKIHTQQLGSHIYSHCGPAAVADKKVMLFPCTFTLLAT